MHLQRNVGMTLERAVEVVDAVVELDEELGELGAYLRVRPHEIDASCSEWSLVEHLVAHAGDEHADQASLTLRHCGNVRRR